MTVLVYGLGRSGIAVSRLLTKQGHTVIGYDQHPKDADLSALKDLGASFTRTPLQTNATLCVAAPGVPIDHPDLVALREQGVETIGEVEWVQRSINADIIGITGTAGKSTVTQWLSYCLQEAGHIAPAGGNVDPALSAVAQDGATLVTELSSFQLERCPTLKPCIAIILNVGSDHLDRHGTTSAYQALKHKLIEQQDNHDVFIYNADDAIVANWAKTAAAKPLGYSLQHKADAYVQNNTLMLHETPLLNTQDLRVNGQHFVANALAVALAAHERGLSHEQIRHGLTQFQGVTGRYSTILTTPDNIRIIEDSIATRPLAVKAALESSQAPVVWIAGGADKGATITEFTDLIQEKVALFIAVGASAPAYAAQVQGLTRVHQCEQTNGEAALECAVRTGLECLRGLGRGGTLLLAPMAASFDQFVDYKERAQVFRQVVARQEASWMSS